MSDDFEPNGKFKKGNRAGVGNGRPRIGPDLRGLDTLTKDEFKRLLKKYSEYSLNDLKAFCEDWNNPAIDMLVCRVLATAIKDGDHAKLNYIATVLIGKKALEEVEIESDENYHRKIVNVIHQIEQKGQSNGNEESRKDEKDQDDDEKA